MSVSACGIDNRPAGERPGNIPNALRARHSLRIEEEEIYANGKLAEKLFSKYQEKKVGIKAIGLPSTSPANAAYSLERLVEIWSEQIKQK